MKTGNKVDLAEKYEKLLWITINILEDYMYRQI